jgi:hypothetical protein
MRDYTAFLYVVPSIRVFPIAFHTNGLGPCHAHDPLPTTPRTSTIPSGKKMHQHDLSFPAPSSRTAVSPTPPPLLLPAAPSSAPPLFSPRRRGRFHFRRRRKRGGGRQEVRQAPDAATEGARGSGHRGVVAAASASVG